MSTEAVAADRFRSALVIGAAGGMGATLLQLLLADGHGVHGVDLAPAPELAQGDIRAPDDKLSALLASADLVVLAVPDALAIEIGASVARRLQPSALLVDCTSVKAGYVGAVSTVAQINCELLSINPLFGPGLDWKGRTFAVTPIRSGPASERFQAALRRAGVKALAVSAEAHDSMAAEAQASLHALLIAYLAAQTTDAGAFAPPPTAIATRLAARVVTGAPDVYWEIQTANPLAHEARRRLIEALTALDHAAASGDRGSFNALVDQARGQLGSDADLYKRQALRLFEHLHHIAGEQS